MKLTKSVLVILALPIAFAACNKSDDPANNAAQANKDQGLQSKIFRGDCSLRVLDAIATGLATAGQSAIKSSREQFQFVGANVTRATLVYTSTDCSGTAALEYKEEGTFDIDPNNKTTDGGQYIDLDYNTLTVMVHTEDGAKIAQEVQLCGSKDWASGTKREVNAASADINCYRRKVPSKELNVYKRDNNDLYFGQRGLTQGVEVRPTSVDMQTKYIAD